MLENFVFHIVRRNSSKELPVALKEVKSFLGINNSKDDDLLLSFTSICTEYAQWYIEKSLSKQTWVISYAVNDIPKKINLPFGPLISVLLVKFKNACNESSILPSEKYCIDLQRSSVTFFESFEVRDVEVTYESGYVSAEHIPAQIKYGILHHIAVCYKNRDLAGQQCLAYLKEIYQPFRDVKLVL